jgi:hypothetical protein
VAEFGEFRSGFGVRGVQDAMSDNSPILGFFWMVGLACPRERSSSRIRDSGMVVRVAAMLECGQLKDGLALVGELAERPAHQIASVGGRVWPHAAEYVRDAIGWVGNRNATETAQEVRLKAKSPVCL